MAEGHDSKKRSGSMGWAVLLGLLVVGVLVQLLAPDAEHGGHGFVFSENGFYIFDFVVLVVGLVWFVRRPLRQFLRQRRVTLEREIDEARRLQAEARASLEEYKAKLANLDAEVEKIKERARQDGEALRNKLVAEGEEQAKKLLEDAEARVRQESRLLKERLEAELIAVATSRAEELVAKGLSADRQRKFVSDYVTEVEGMAASGKAGRA